MWTSLEHHLVLTVIALLCALIVNLSPLPQQGEAQTQHCAHAEALLVWEG